MSKNFGMKIEGAMSADEWIASGHAWNPEVSLTATDVIESRFVNHLVGEACHFVVAYAVTMPFPGCFCVELQFNKPAHAKEVRDAYRNAFTASGAMKRSVREFFSNPVNLQLDDTGKPLRHCR